MLYFWFCPRVAYSGVFLYNIVTKVQNFRINYYKPKYQKNEQRTNQIITD